MRKYLGAIYALLMWASGTGFILITLSGATLEKALMLSGATLAVMLVAIGLGIGMDD
jgi:hypothetical protein